MDNIGDDFFDFAMSTVLDSFKDYDDDVLEGWLHEDGDGFDWFDINWLERIKSNKCVSDCFIEIKDKLLSYVALNIITEGVHHDVWMLLPYCIAMKFIEYVKGYSGIVSIHPDNLFYVFYGVVLYRYIYEKDDDSADGIDNDSDGYVDKWESIDSISPVSVGLLIQTTNNTNEERGYFVVGKYEQKQDSLFYYYPEGYKVYNAHRAWGESWTLLKITDGSEVFIKHITGKHYVYVGINTDNYVSDYLLGSDYAYSFGGITFDADE